MTTFITYQSQWVINITSHPALRAYARIKHQNKLRIKILLIVCLLRIFNIAVADEFAPGLKVEKLEEGIYIDTSFEEYTGFGIVEKMD